MDETRFQSFKVSTFQRYAGFVMSAEAKTHYGSTLVLLVLGMLALYGGANWLVVLIPAAVLVWVGAHPALRSGRN